MECSLQTNLCSAFLLSWEYNTSKAQFQAQYSLTIRMSKIFIVFQTKVLCFYTYLLFIVFFEKSILKFLIFGPNPGVMLMWYVLLTYIVHSTKASLLMTQTAAVLLLSRIYRLSRYTFILITGNIFVKFNTSNVTVEI